MAHNFRVYTDSDKCDIIIHPTEAGTEARPGGMRRRSAGVAVTPGPGPAAVTPGGRPRSKIVTWISYLEKVMTSYTRDMTWISQMQII